MRNSTAVCEPPLSEGRAVGKKTYKHKERPLFLRLPPAYHDALAAMARKSRRTLTAEAMIAFEQYFSANGVSLPGQPAPPPAPEARP